MSTAIRLLVGWGTLASSTSTPAITPGADFVEAPTPLAFP